jgi:ureidoglycolate dehydrogenase (NAD+)
MPAPTTVVPSTDLTSYCARLFAASGVPSEAAEVAARIQVHADLRGVHSHGARAIPGYIRQIRSGAVNPRPAIRILRETASCIHLDADLALGQVVSDLANRKAIEAARRTGVGVVCVRNSTHYGAAGYYAIAAAEAGTIGFNSTGPRRQTGNMAPFGSIEPVTGNHPMAWGIPAGKERPVVLDMACGVAAAGKIGMAKARGERIPEGWAMTVDGRPTTDPDEASVIVPLGPKGSGLAIVMHCIAGILPGAGFGDREPFGHLFIAIDVSAFVDLSAFKAEVDERIASLRAAAPAPGVTRVYYPGEIEWLTLAERERNGIPMLDLHLEELADLGKELGVAAPWT